MIGRISPRAASLGVLALGLVGAWGTTAPIDSPVHAPAPPGAHATASPIAPGGGPRAPMTPSPHDSASPSPARGAAASFIAPSGPTVVPPTTAAAPTGAGAPPRERCAPEPPIDTSMLYAPLALMILVGERPRWFGSASIGAPTRGSLWGGVELLESAHIERAGGYPWGIESVVRSIERAAREVHRCHPGSPRLITGDLSREHGGWLRPHRSHQSGLDADLGYFYRGPSTWYQRVNASNFDAPRTWTLVRSLIEGGNVDTIFMDLSIQRLLRAHLDTLPEDERGPEDLFVTPTRREAVIRHTWGHATHLHVRFRDAEASRLGAQVKTTLADPLERARKARRRW